MCAQVKEKLEIIRVFEDLALQTGVVVCTRFPDMLTGSFRPGSGISLACV